MAHGLRYYKELTHADGKVVRLELLQKDYAGASMEIGPVCQSLRLDIQGDTEIDAPIVKTSLSMTFVDAPDHVDAQTKKCGNWAEFYTNDATYWQVVVKAKNAGETDFKRVWGGYVTPDSYNEVLVYRGSVTIVARDNIGHLSDFPFDAVGNADGMITLIELIREAWDKIESPMWLDDQAVANADWLMSEGAYAYDTYMNVSAFESKNWYDALESALYAYGLVMRYTGWNNVSFYSLRNMPRMGAYEVDDIDYREPVFEAGAERELTPAVKRIEEAVEYKLTDSKSAPMAKSIKFVGSTSTIPFESKNMFDEKEWKNIDVWPITNTSGLGWGNGADSNPLYFNPAGYPCEQSIKDDAKNSIYLATNTDNSGAVWYAQMFRGKRFKFTMTFGRLVARDIAIASKPTVMPTFNPDLIIKKVKISVAATSNGVSKYMTEKGKWQTDGVIFEIAIDEDSRQASKTVYLDSLSEDDCLVLIAIHGITLGGKGGADWYDSSKGGGIYVALQSLTFAEAHGDALCETNRVNTNYDQTNNVILSRQPKIAPALDDVLFPSIIKNGIFVKVGNTYHPAKLWNWGGQTPQQMAVYNHLQLLCYHAKPNNILRGTILNADITKLQTIWLWSGAEHIFVSGSINFLNGHIENAVLREFARYEDMWSAMLDPADLPNVDGGSVTNVESGSASKSEGARNTINTEVYLGGGNIVLDDYMSDESENGVMNRVIKAYVDDVRADFTDLWHLDENGNLVTDKQVIIKNNLIVEQDTSSGGEGEDVVVGIQGVRVNGSTYYGDENGIVDLGTISGGGGSTDLSNYYTKTQSDARYLALSGGTINGNSVEPLIINSSASSVGIRLRINGANAAYIGYGGTSVGTYIYNYDCGYYIGVGDGIPYFHNGTYNTLIHSGNIGSYNAGGAKKLTPYNGICDYAAGISTMSFFTDWGLTNTLGSYLYGISMESPDASYKVQVGHALWKGLYWRDMDAGTWTSWKKIVTENADGNVGVGTTSPQYKFNLVNGSNAGYDIFSKNSINNASFGVGQYGLFVDIPDINNNIIELFRAGSKVFSVKGNGDVTVSGAIVPSSANTSRIGGFNNYFSTSYINVISCGAKDNNLWLVGGNAASTTGIQFARSADGSTDGRIGTWDATGLYPATDNAYVLGTYEYLWSSVWSHNGKFINVNTIEYYRIPLTSAGWKKVAIDNKNLTSSNVIINIKRIYNNTNNETYTFLVNCAYNGQTTITQIGGHANYIAISQIAVYNPPAPYDRAIYIYYNTSAANDVIVNCIGDFDAIKPEAATLPSSNVKTMNTTSTGFATTGNAVIAGDTSSGSDIRFKDVIKNKTLKIEHIAKAPLFTFRWNDREDDSVHLGSSAQYWENIAPWLVSGSEFKSLNYATLGVAMGISLAKKAVNHEERIKVLEKEIKRLKEEMIHG